MLQTVLQDLELPQEIGVNAPPLAVVAGPLKTSLLKSLFVGTSGQSPMLSRAGLNN